MLSPRPFLSGNLHATWGSPVDGSCSSRIVNMAGTGRGHQYANQRIGRVCRWTPPLSPFSWQPRANAACSQSWAFPTFARLVGGKISIGPRDSRLRDVVGTVPGLKNTH